MKPRALTIRIVTTLLCITPILVSAQLVEPRIELFNGFSEQSKVTLEWKLSAVDQLESIVVEKAESPDKFEKAAEVTIKDNSHTSFRFEDNNAGSEKVYYRLKLVTLDGETGFSKVLPFRLINMENASFTVFPTVVANDLMLRIKSEKRAPGVLRIINYSGNTVHQKTISLQDGMNTVLLEEITRFPAGNYVAVLETGGNKTTQKIIKL
jgi:hypothetical protein